MLLAWVGRRVLPPRQGSRALHDNKQPTSVFLGLEAEQERGPGQAFPDLWETVAGDRALALNPWSDHGYECCSDHTLGLLFLQILEELQC